MDQARGNLGVMVLRLGHVPFNLQGDARTALKQYLEARAIHEKILKEPGDGFYKELDLKRILSFVTSTSAKRCSPLAIRTRRASISRSRQPSASSGPTPRPRM